MSSDFLTSDFLTSDFFTNQDRARRNTGRLVALFIAGVASTILTVWLATVVVIAFSTIREDGPQWADAFGNWRPPAAVALVVCAIVGIATLIKLAQLARGGEQIAEMLGGRRVDPATRDPKERQLVNVVEEMSIASGVPVPPVYVIDSPGINAFAAGPDPSRSVIGMTRGALDLLDRDELQGVVAHEYSHIFHGDTRINARVTATIAGIMALGVLGYVLLRHVGPAIARSSGGSRKNNGAAIGVAIIAIGAFLWALGSIGVLFGRLIQAAISRQREFLADAAAVQYTRNPDGIGGALAKIRDHSARVEVAGASELNHFFFASSLQTLFATHPPIDRRIAAIRAMGATRIPEQRVPASAEAASRAAQAHGAAAGVAGFAGASPPPPPPAARAGALDAATIAVAHAWRASLPAGLSDAAHDPIGARAICYAVARRPSGHRDCDAAVAGGDRDAYETYSRLAGPIAGLRSDARLALVDLAGPALLALGRERYRGFRETLAQAMRSDGKVDIEEWALARSLERHVERRLAGGPGPDARLRLDDLAGEIRTVLSIIASTQHQGDDVERSFNRAYGALGVNAPATAPVAERTLDALNAAVRRFSSLRFTERARLLNACASAAAHAGGVSVEEHLIVRSVADALDVPIPALAAVA